MKFECRTEQLIRTAHIVERIATKRSTTPILQCVLFRATQKHITCAATNLEIGIQAVIAGIVQRDGAVAVSASLFGQFIGTLKAGDTAIVTSQGNDLVIDIGKEQSRFPGIDPTEFPTFPGIDIVHTLHISGPALARAIERALPSAARMSTKQELMGIYCAVGKDDIVVAATDSFRLTEEIIPSSEYKSAQPHNMLVPTQTAEILARLLSEEQDQVKIESSEQFCVVSSPFYTLYSRLLEGKFPDYRSILPKKFTTTASFQFDEFIGHVKRARIFSGRLHELTLSINPDHAVQIRSGSAQSGEYNATIPARTEGVGVVCALNWQYLTDALLGFSGKELLIGFNGTLDPVLIRENGNPRSLSVIMPMRSAQ